MTYRTFRRTCTNWRTFFNARKITDLRGLTLEAARRRCDRLNSELTKAQIKRGTKFEFERE